MSSIDHRLTANETLIFCTKCHWAIFIGPILVIIIGGLAVKSQGIHAFTLMAFGLVWCLCSYIILDKLEIGLTQERILINGVFPLSKSYDISLREIIAIDFYQPALGAMLGFGKIWIVYREHSRFSVRFVSSPALFVGEVRQRLSLSNG